MLAEKAVNLFRNVFGLKATVYQFDKSRAILVRLYCLPVASFFKENFGDNAQEKHLPNWMLTLPVRNQKFLMVGLFEGDGYTIMGAQIYNTASRVLAFQVSQMLLRAGAIPEVRYDSNYKSKIGIYEVAIRNSRIGFFWNGFLLLPIKSIRKIPYVGKVYNLEVEDDNSYVTSSAIAHNCLTAQLLGPSMISKGGLAYIGSYETWTWVDSDGAGDPYADIYAKCFFESANAIAIALLNGKTVGEATAMGMERYSYWIDWWGRSTDANAPEIIKWLIWDKENTRQLGLAEASATTVVQVPLAAASPALPVLSLLVGALAGSIPDKRRNQLVAFTLGTLGTFGLGIYIKKKSAPGARAS
jgi:hypothetical protein